MWRQHMEQYNSEFAEAIKNINKICEPARQAVQYASEYMKKIGEQVRKVFEQYDFSKMYQNLLIPMQQFAQEIEKIKNDPDSLLNYMSYVKNLSNYFWAMPYSIDTSELKSIFENVKTEKEFDDYMKKYFTNQKLQQLFNDIKLKISRKHITIFKQIEQAFYNKQYSLINNAIISIIDDELSYYNYNKKETKRKDILYPIIEEYQKKDVSQCDWLDLFYLEMLNNNINLLFDNVDFNNIKISNNKAIRRHTTQHGKKYSNKKIVSIMLLNTLYNLLYIKEDLEVYKQRLKVKKEKDGSTHYILVQKNKK